MRCSAKILLPIVCLAFLLPVFEVAAKNRLYRRFDHRDGLDGAVVSLAQDAEGFLWVGVIGGLLRFDGSEFRRWNRMKLDSQAHLRTHPEFGVLALVVPEGRIYRVGDNDLEPLFEDLERVSGPVSWIEVGADGSLWLVEDSSVLHRRDPSGVWVTYEIDIFDGAAPRLVYASSQGGAYVCTLQGLWHIEAAGTAELILERKQPTHVAEHPNGALYVLIRGGPGGLIEIKDGVVRTISSQWGRWSGLVVRGEDVWFSARTLYRYRPGEAVEEVEPENSYAVPAASYLLVDREGSLWLGGTQGLSQLPEPDTVSLTDRDGMPAGPGWTELARTSEGVWMPGWDGLALVRDGLDASQARSGFLPKNLCVDRQDRLWTFEGVTGDMPSIARAGILERSGGRFQYYPVGGTVYGNCARSSDGTVWIHVDERLYKTPVGSGPPELVGRIPLRSPHFFNEQDGRLWLGDTGGIWSVSIDGTDLQDEDIWEHEEVPGIGWARDLHIMPSGARWAVGRGGMFRDTGGGWESVPGAPELVYRGIFESPAGGVWLTSEGPLIRVTERTDPAQGIEILERPTMWQGLPETWNPSLMEDPDGTLWISSSSGLIHMPAEARLADQPVPNVALVDVRVDGQRVQIGEIRLPYAKNRLELSFAALSYRDPGLIRYRVRSQPNHPWNETRTPNFRFADLAPGTYEPQVIASLDGENWSVSPATLSFRVLPPWYRTWWAMTLLGLVATASLYAAYRARLAVVLRLERQRTRIAMDLHDEMGAGLGSIGILAEMAASEDVEPTKRDDILSRIIGTTGELGSNLRDILWSLRTHADDVEGLAVHLAERASGLFPGGRVRFRTEFPEHFPAVRLSLSVRRNLQRIALEALYNAARHSGATDVVLGFAPDGNRWAMWVRDDGVGMPADKKRQDAASGHGLGLESMRARARQIGAKIVWKPAKPSGTEVRVHFSPGATDRRVAS